jgi:hypothetical protein
MTANKILINRAPVLTLWAEVVAERLGFDYDEALSMHFVSSSRHPHGGYSGFERPTTFP